MADDFTTVYIKYIKTAIYSIVIDLWFNILKSISPRLSHVQRLNYLPLYPNHKPRTENPLTHLIQNPMKHLLIHTILFIFINYLFVKSWIVNYIIFNNINYSSISYSRIIVEYLIIHNKINNHVLSFKEILLHSIIFYNFKILFLKNLTVVDLFVKVIIDR